MGLAKLEESVEKEVHAMNQEGEKSFQKEFGLPQTERLLGGKCKTKSVNNTHRFFNYIQAFGCKVLNGTTGVGGSAYLSNNHFCFKGGSLRVSTGLNTSSQIVNICNESSQF